MPSACFENTIPPAEVLADLDGGGPLRVWLDDDTDSENRIAGEEWVQVTTAFQALALLGTGRVIELSLDNDLGDDQRFGQGKQVVDFLCEQEYVHDRSLWPAEGVVIHSANPEARDQMTRAIERFAPRVRRSLTSGGQRRFTF